MPRFVWVLCSRVTAGRWIRVLRLAPSILVSAQLEEARGAGRGSRLQVEGRNVEWRRREDKLMCRVTRGWSALATLGKERRGGGCAAGRRDECAKECVSLVGGSVDGEDDDVPQWERS